MDIESDSSIDISLESIVEQDGLDISNTAGVITWEPVATWIERKSSEGPNTVEKINILNEANDDGRLKTITFDLIIKKSTLSKKWESILNFSQVFLPRLQSASNLLNDISSNDIQSDKRDILLKLSQIYKILPTDEKASLSRKLNPIRKAVGGINYNVDIDPNFFREIIKYTTERERQI